MLIGSRSPRPRLASITAALLSLAVSSYACADTFAEGISTAFTDGDVALNLRYRYEFVDQDNKPEDAKASTLRTRLTLKSGKVGGFSGLIEVDNLSYMGSDDFNNTENGRFDHAVVADPDYTEINQAFISYAFSDKNTATIGRQRINHSGQRFLGNVGWRQNEQTFDAARLQLAPSDRLTIDYSYIWQVNRIFGPDGGDAEFDGDSHALIADYKIAEGHKLSAYSYILDLDQSAALSSKTFGLEYKGTLALGDTTSLGIHLSAAKQREYGDNTANFSTDYYLGELTAKYKPVSISLGLEVLGSDNGVSFKTPLATLHKFQGFADKFLVTPAMGIEDSYVKVVSQLGSVKLIAFYHDFEAETGGANYGSEFDLVAAYKISERYSVMFKYAAYDADDFGSDTDKAWLMLSAAF